MAPTTTAAPRGRKRKEPGSSNGKNERRFACQNDGCGRSFTRAEHLQRHLLNHSTGEFTCGRCRAHFKRRDLLGKHIDFMALCRLSWAQSISGPLTLDYHVHSTFVSLLRPRVDHTVVPFFSALALRLSICIGLLRLRTPLCCSVTLLMASRKAHVSPSTEG